MRALLLLLCLSSCSVYQHTEFEVERENPDGSKVKAKFNRAWADGPVSLSATYDPASGIVTFTWSSDVSLDNAVAASQAQTAAQTEAIQSLAPILSDLLHILTGIREVQSRLVPREPPQIEHPDFPR